MYHYCNNFSTCRLYQWKLYLLFSGMEKEKKNDSFNRQKTHPPLYHILGSVFCWLGYDRSKFEKSFITIMDMEKLRSSAPPPIHL